MCCFSAKTEVHGTRIFARMTRPDAQLVVYQMQYKAEQPTAMILPLPVALPAAESSVSWKSLKEYGAFFDDLATGFPAVVDRSWSAPKSQTASAVAVAPLEVHEVGDFVASFVPRVADFDRLDPRFVLSKDVWAKLPQYADYGFAVFQLKELSGSPHPIAFEFASRLRDTIFFPTVHIHDGTVHKDADFDHILYLQDARFDAHVSGYAGPDKADSHTGYVRSQDKVASFADVKRAAGALNGELLLHRMSIAGTHPNVDTLASLAHAGASAGCSRCDTAGVGAAAPRLGPAGAVAAGLAWIIRRRDALSRR
jgi:hypothetical protein